MPGQAMEEARNARLKDPALTEHLREAWQKQFDWHRDLPENVQEIPGSDPALQAKLLAEHGELHVSDGVNSRLEGIATIDELVRPGAPPARVPVPEPEIPGLRRAGMTAGLAGLGVAATAYDASQTGERVGTLLAQDNLTAARSEALHFSARGIGGWAGGTAAAAVVGTTGAGPVALVVADGYLFSAAADKAVTLWDNRQIYTQTDKQGVSWEFNGSQWLRQEKADLPNDGVDAPQKQAMFALPEKARELSYHASSEATDRRLARCSPVIPMCSRPVRQMLRIFTHVIGDTTRRVASGHGWSPTKSIGTIGPSGRLIRQAPSAVPGWINKQPRWWTPTLPVAQLQLQRLIRLPISAMDGTILAPCHQPCRQP